jgi:hypothetical protein
MTEEQADSEGRSYSSNEDDTIYSCKQVEIEEYKRIGKGKAIFKLF